MQIARMRGWTPVGIQLDAAERLEDGVTGVVTFRANLVPRATDAGSFVFKAWQAGSVVAEQRLAGRVSSAERTRLQGIRDALMASDFLRRASIVNSTTTPLPIGSMRITVTDADGTRRAYTSPADDQSLLALDAAFEAWSLLAFPELDAIAQR